LSPFAFELWLTIIVAILGFAVLLTVTSFINIKYNYKKSHVSRHFSLQNSWHYVLGILCQQGKQFLYCIPTWFTVGQANKLLIQLPKNSNL
jgi:hypothetical protein